MHTPLIFNANKKKASLVFIGSLCFVALGYWIAPQWPGIGWSCVVLFASRR